ncbi:MAG: hypothetical protein AAB885_00645 [Patescibacteria group bacterium]
MPNLGVIRREAQDAYNELGERPKRQSPIVLFQKGRRTSRATLVRPGPMDPAAIDAMTGPSAAGDPFEFACSEEERREEVQAAKNRAWVTERLEAFCLPPSADYTTDRDLLEALVSTLNGGRALVDGRVSSIYSAAYFR